MREVPSTSTMPRAHSGLTLRIQSGLQAAFGGLSVIGVVSLIVYLIKWVTSADGDPDELAAVGTWGAGIGIPVVGAYYALYRANKDEKNSLASTWAKTTLMKGPSVRVERERAAGDVAKATRSSTDQTGAVTATLTITPAKDVSLRDLTMGFIGSNGKIYAQRTDIHIARPRRLPRVELEGPADLKRREQGVGQRAPLRPYLFRAKLPKKLAEQFSELKGIEIEHLRSRIEREISLATIASFVVDGRPFIAWHNMCWPRHMAPKQIRREAKTIEKFARKNDTGSGGYTRAEIVRE